MGKIFKLKRDTYITEAKTEFGSSIECHVESFMGESVFAYSQDPYGGFMFLIQADSWEAAYEAAIDLAPTINEEDLPEAYGFYGDNAKAEFETACEGDDRPELVEGYQYQSNFTGTGIVDSGHYETLAEISPDCARELKVQVRRDD